MSLPAGVTNRLIMVRHGEPVAAAKGMCYGKLDVGLSDEGKGQLARTAVWLERFEASAIYSSPRVRAAESADIIAEKLRLPVRIDDRFAEMNFGDFEGLTYDRVRAEYPQIYECWMTRPTEVEFPNGESFTVMRRRVTAGLAELRKIYEGRTIVVVSHGGVNRIALVDALDMPHGNLFRFEQTYGCANVVDFYADFPVVRLINHNFADRQNS